MNKLHFFFICCCLFLHTYVNGQDAAKTLVQFPSPEATNLGIVGNLPVSLHTGKLSVDIPLSVGDGKNIPPISLSYNTGGIMPDFHPGWTGLNWTLNGGGVVTRSMNFIPDETDEVGFYYTYGIAGTMAYFNPTLYMGGSRCWNDICTSADGSADEFYVSGPGLSGKFMIDYYGQFRMIEDPAIKIETDMTFDLNWGYVDMAYKPFKGFTITKSDGTKYKFGYAKELIETMHSVDAGYTIKGTASAWYLAQIIYPDGDTVNYTYTPKVINYTPAGNDVSIHSYMFHDLYGQEFPPTDGRSSAHGAVGIFRTATNHAYMQSIESKLARLDFYTSTTNELKNGVSDLGNWKRLDSIVVVNKLTAQKEKTVVFTYDADIKKRLTLLSVTTKGATNESLPPYEFSYDPNPLPIYQSGLLDYWGYYNNTPYFSMIPSVVWPDPAPTAPFYYSPNREPNPRTVGNGMLKEIKYPTGGTVAFEYEPNEYSFFRHFTTDNTTTVLEPVKYGWELPLFFNEQPNYYTNYSHQRYFYNGSPAVTFTKYMDAAISGSGIANGVLYRVLEPGTYTVESIQQMLGIPYYIGNAYTITYYEMVPRKKALGPGLRIKRVVHKNSGAIEMVREYVYAKNFNLPEFDPDLSSGILGNRGAFIAGASRSGNPGVAFSTSQSPEILTDGSPLGYSEVAEITKDEDGDMLGYVINKYTNFDTNADDLPSVFGPNAMLLAKKNNKYYERGKLRESTTYSSSGEKIKKTDNWYQPQIFSISNGVTLRTDLLFGTAQAYPNSVNQTLVMIRYRNYFGTSPLTSHTETYYSQNGNESLQQATTYLYTANMLPQQITTATSTGVKKQTFTYPSDIPSPVYDLMVKRNMLNYPVETITYAGANIKEGSLNTYMWNINGGDTIILADNIYKFAEPAPVTSINPFNGSSMCSSYGDPYTDFLKFDSWGNVLEARDRSGITTVYLWGYASKYPVASIKGASYDAVSAILNQAILQNPPSDQVLRDELQKIRNQYPGAHVTSYTYKPLVGISSQTDPGNHTTYNEYDGFGRLKHIRDQDNNILKTYDYKYQVQQ